MGRRGLCCAVMVCATAPALRAEAQVQNLTTGQFYQTIAEAIRAASAGDQLLADAAQFGLEPLIDYLGKPIGLRSTAAIVQPAGFNLLLAPGASLEAAAGSDAAFGGLLRLAADNPSTISAASTTESSVSPRAGRSGFRSSIFATTSGSSSCG